MKVKMFPGRDSIGQPNGISRVIEAYYRYGPQYGIEFVDDDNYDLLVGHAGTLGSKCDVSILHGIYFTGDYSAPSYEYKVNVNIADSIRSSKVVTVPSEWVGEIVKRNAKINPFVIPHGINLEEWKHDFPHEDYVLYNKGRDDMDVCDSTQMDKLASMSPNTRFVSTYSRSKPSNVKVIGVLPHEEIKPVIQKASVYLSITKETFGIGTLEAMASGVPVLGWNYGGNRDLVQHGVNGYLAIPGDYEDLARGLKYCIANRKTLGKNSAKLAQNWTWEKAIEKLKQAFDEAYRLKFQKPTVSVIIPVYNYGSKVKNAVDSLLEQTQKPDEIILVNDGSTDNSYQEMEDLVNAYSKWTKSLILMDKKNGGVATARNTGAYHSTGKYICFLDADDAVAPQFIERCVEALEKDNSLYIAYTTLKWIDQQGNSGISQWPGQYDFDNQIKHKNQVPTCCVMRREVFTRLGGQRQRYAPHGAGSEDADFWTRAGLYGMGARKVTEEPLFLYSVGAGNVSGNKQYREEDWLKWHSCIQTGHYPFLSLATPKHFSHPVVQYDEPVISVIIPVGPGHESNFIEALDSLEAQTFSKWEAIVVWDSENKPADEISGYPYARIIHTPKPCSGAGAARNLGAKNARGMFVVFLDADDYLVPEALEEMLIHWNNNQGIVYSDYLGVATVDKSDIAKFGSNVVEYDESRKHAVILHHSQEYNCEMAQNQPNKELYHWCIVTCLIPKVWHQSIGGFDESMESWEDVDYHWRMARSGKCYSRINKPLVIYHFDTGKRRMAASSENNVQTAQKLLQYMQKKYEGIKNMPCVTCGQHSKNNMASRPGEPASARNVVNQSDTNFVECLYNHQNKGEHPVFGPATRISYGYRGGGEKFLVHVKDVAVSPDLFIPINQMVTMVKITEEPQPLPEPEPIDKSDTDDNENNLVVEKPIREFTPESLPGISSAVAKQLIEKGFNSVESIKSITIDDLKELEGVGAVRAKIIKKSIDSYLEQNG